MADRRVVREGIERVTIVQDLGEHRHSSAHVYKIRRDDGREEIRSGPPGLAGDVFVRLLRVEGIGPKKDITLRVMETNG